jgi:hypothetical protein
MAKTEGFDACRGSGNVADRRDSSSSFDKSQQCHTLLKAEAETLLEEIETTHDVVDRLGAFGFGKHDRAGSCLYDGVEVLVEKRRGDGVDTHGGLTVAKPSATECFGDLDSRRRLLVGHDRVFKVEEKRVGASPAGSF